MNERKRAEGKARIRLRGMRTPADFKCVFWWAFYESIWGNGSPAACADDLLQLIPKKYRSIGVKAIAELRKEWRKRKQDWYYAGD